MKIKEVNKNLEEYGYMIGISRTKENRNVHPLYRKGYGYMASVIMNKDSISFQRKKYTDIKELVDAVEEYTSKLEFSPDTYDPLSRPEYVRDRRVHDTLKKLGFEIDAKSYGSNHYISKGVLCSMYGKIIDNYLVVSDNSFMALYEEEQMDSKVVTDSIKGIVTACYVADIAKLVGYLNDVGKIDSIKDMTIKTVNPNTFEIEEKNGKEGIIRLLEETLEKLKNE